jgi:hypothetical protein
MMIPQAMEALLGLVASTKKSGISEQTLELIDLRASQIQWLQCLR